MWGIFVEEILLNTFNEVFDFSQLKFLNYVLTALAIFLWILFYKAPNFQEMSNSILSLL